MIAQKKRSLTGLRFLKALSETMQETLKQFVEALRGLSFYAKAICIDNFNV